MPKKKKADESLILLVIFTWLLVSLKGCCNVRFLIMFNKYLATSIINGGYHMQSWVGHSLQQLTIWHPYECGPDKSNLLNLNDLFCCCSVKLLSFLFPHSLVRGVKLIHLSILHCSYHVLQLLVLPGFNKLCYIILLAFSLQSVSWERSKIHRLVFKGSI